MNEKITINSHSSIRIEGEKIIYIDPFKIKENVADADFILITHEHYDHYDVESIKKIMNEKTKIIFPDSMATTLLSTFSNKQLVGVIPNETYCIEGLNLETIPSYNINKDFHPRNKNWVGYIITINKERIYIAGDTDITEENQKVQCDIALVPIGGTYTMTAYEAASLVNHIHPKVAIPTHYASIVGTLKDGEIFKKNLKENIECILLIKEETK